MCLKFSIVDTGRFVLCHERRPMSGRDSNVPRSQNDIREGALKLSHMMKVRTMILLTTDGMAKTRLKTLTTDGMVFRILENPPTPVNCIRSMQPLSDAEPASCIS